MSRGELRKTLKIEARQCFEKNKKNLIIASLIIGIVIFISVILSKRFSGNFQMSLVIYIIEVSVVTPLVVGLNDMSLKCIRGNQVRYSDILKGFNMIYQSYAAMLIQLFISFILKFPFIFIPIFFVKDMKLRSEIIRYIDVIANIVFYIIFSQLLYIIADKKDISIIDAIKKSIYIIKDYVWDFILLILSLIGWLILVFLTFGIAYIWVSPYIELILANFYEKIKGDKLNTYKRSSNCGFKLGILMGFALCIYTCVESNISRNIYTPYVIKKVVKENNLKLINFNEEQSYYISKEEGLLYRIERNYTNLSHLSKYTLVVKRHPLDIKKYDKIKSTIVYIIADGDKLLGISCEPNNSTGIIDEYNPIPGKFDMNGNVIK